LLLLLWIVVWDAMRSDGNDDGPFDPLLGEQNGLNGSNGCSDCLSVTRRWRDQWQACKDGRAHFVPDTASADAADAAHAHTIIGWIIMGPIQELFEKPSRRRKPTPTTPTCRRHESRSDLFPIDRSAAGFDKSTNTESAFKTTSSEPVSEQCMCVSI